MVKSIFLLFFVFSTTALISAELVEVNGKESEEFQESAFIKLMSKLNGGEIPYPFSKLLDSFGTGARENGNLLFVPKGRSLVKESADYHNPRIISAPIADSLNFSLQGDNSDEQKKWAQNKKLLKDLGIDGSDLFIGFAPNHKALEVISYNPKKPGYDFFVIENYEEGKTPKIVNNPALCLTCHQNEGPIFPKLPWHELLGDTANPENSKEFFGSNKNRLMEQIIKENSERTEIEGISLANEGNFSASKVAFFDTLVRNGNTNITDNKVCQSLCSDKNSIECQKELIEISFGSKPDFTKSPFFKNAIKNLNSITIKSSVIPDRDPRSNMGFKDLITNKQLSELTEEKNAIDGKKVKALLGGEKKEYDVTFFELPFGQVTQATEDLNYINPATIRPTNSVIAELQLDVKNAKSLNDKISIIAEFCFDPKAMLNGLPKERFNLEILNKPHVLNSLKEWPSTEKFRKIILKEISEFKEIEKQTIDCNTSVSPVIPVYKYSSLNNIVKKLNDEAITKPMALFSKYCIQCHGGPSPFIPLPLTSTEQMSTYKPRFGTVGVQEKLEKKLMPPSFAEFQPTEKERSEMIKIIKDLKK